MLIRRKMSNFTRYGVCGSDHMGDELCTPQAAAKQRRQIVKALTLQFVEVDHVA